MTKNGKGGGGVGGANFFAGRTKQEENSALPTSFTFRAMKKKVLTSNNDDVNLLN